MGMFDTFKVDDCDGQVKIYDNVMDVFELGCNLPCEPFGVEDYGIKLRNGGWVVVKYNTFLEYQENMPCLVHLYDKWGFPWDEENPKYD